MSIRRLFFFLFFAIAFVAMAGIPTNSHNSGQNNEKDKTLIAGRNVNMVSGITLPGGDPYLQRQNEPSIAASTRNPLHLLAGANDYRTIDIPGKPEDELPGQEEKKETAQAPREPWLGVFKSFDGGQSWISTLLPGFPQDSSPEGMNSPLKYAPDPQKGFRAAADPVVRAGTNGLFYYSGIAFNRTKILNQINSVVFLARFIDKNNIEGGDSIKYIDTKIVADDEMQDKVFVDKPWIAVDVPKNHSKTVTIEGQQIPRGNVYIAYSVFSTAENSFTSEIIFRRSTNCGETWEKPIVLSKGHELNQGAVIAVDPRGNGHVYVAWRRFSSGAGKKTQSSAIIVARSANAGEKFHKIVEVATFDPFPYGSFDQPSTDNSTNPPGTSFRTNSYPTMTVDDTGAIYLGWAQRGWGPDREARIILTTSRNGIQWSPPSPIDNLSYIQGHQFMPSLAFAAGKLTLVWHDQRDSYSGQENGFGDWISDNSLFRHTIDVWAAQADTSDYPNLNWIFTQVSRYLFHTEEDPNNPGTYKAYQAQFNPPNYPLFKSGTVPFHGDYLDITPSPMFVLDENGHWRFNTEPSDNPIFHVTWTDNRDVRPPDDGNWVNYAPPNSPQDPKYVSDGSPLPCEGGQKPGMRNQNIYTSRITSGIETGSPTNTKALDLEVPRAFVIFVKNQTELLRSFRLTVANQPPGGQASFLQFDFLETLDVSIAPYSTISRQVFVGSTEMYAAVGINIDEIDKPGGNILTEGSKGFVLLNGDPTSPGITGGEETHQPEIDNPNIVNWFVNPNIVNPNIVNPNIVNPNIVNPNIVNPNIVNPNIVNPNIVNPNIVNPNIVNPNIVNPNIVNPNIVNPNIVNASPEDISITDVEWPVRNAGNTTSSFTFKIIAKEALPAGIYSQLIVYKVHYTPAVAGKELSSEYTNYDACQLYQEPTHEVLLNVVNPNIVNPNIVNPNIVNPNIVNAAIENATFVLGPGEEAIVNLRIIDTIEAQNKRGILSKTAWQPPDVLDFVESLGGAVSAQSADSEDAEQGIEEPAAAATILIFSTSSLPPGTIGETYPPEEYSIDAKLKAIGGTGLYSWWIDPADLPPGLDLDTATGQIYGIPTVAGTFYFTAQVTDSGTPQQSDNQTLSITIEDPEVLLPLSITSPSPLPIGTERKPYGATLEASGGVWPYTWTMASGSLPTGLSLDSGGFISGMSEIDIAGTYNFRIRVTDSGTPADSDEKDFTLIIKEYDAQTYTISGTVTIGDGGPPLPGVLIRGLPGAPTTNSSGFYTDTVSEDWSGTATPFKAGYYFNPPERGYTNVTSSQLDQNYDALPVELDHFDFGVIGNQTAGIPFIITITAKDSSGDTVFTYSDTNTLSDTTGTIIPTSTGAFISGVWTGQVTITKSAIGITITTTGGGKTGDSNVFNLIAGATAILRIEDADDGTGTEVDTKTTVLGESFTVYAILRDIGDNFIENTSVTWDLIGETGDVGDLVPAGDYKSATFTAHGEGTAKIAVYYLSLYDETGTITVTGTPLDDLYDLNEKDNDDFNSAAEIFSGTYTNLQLLDEDWYKIYVDAYKDLKVTIAGVLGNNIDLGLADSAGKYLVGGLSSSNEDSIHFNTTSSGLFYIRVPYTRESGLQNTYTLTVEISDDLGLGQVSGKVTDSSNNPLQVRVRVFDRYGYRKWNTLTDATGDYKISIPPGSYKIRFITSPILDYYSGINYLSEYSHDKPRFAEAPLIEVQADSTIQDIDGQLEQGGTITGTVRDLQGNTIEGAYIRIRDLDGYSAPSAYSDGSGIYTIERLTKGYFKAYVRSWTENHGIEWYYDKPSFNEANAIFVETGQTASGIDFQLTESGSVEGRVTDANGGVGGITVVAYDSSQIIPYLYPSAQIPRIGLRSTSTDNNGNYFMDHLPTGNVSLYFNTSNTNHVPKWYDDASKFENSVPVPIQAGQTTSDINVVLAESGAVGGRVTNSSGDGLKDVLVWIFNLEGGGYYQKNLYTNDDGYYHIDRIPVGNVKVRFRPNIYTSPHTGNWAVEWYGNKNSYAEADDVTVVANETTWGIDAVLAENGGNIEGYVKNISGQGIGGVYVSAYDSSIQAQVSFVYTETDGHFSVPRIPTCNVKLAFATSYNKLPYVSEFYDNQSSYEYATPVWVELGQTTTLPYDVVLSDRPDLAVTTTSPLPNGDVGTPYSQALVAEGGTKHYHWSLASGSLPNGLYLKSTGVIEGTPTTQGPFNFTVKVVDSSYPPQEAFSQNLSITINFSYPGSDIIISGKVTYEGSPLGGVLMDGLPDNTRTNASGYYFAFVSSSWSGTVTPTLPDYAFVPYSREYNSVTSHQPNQNYDASTAYTISGTVTVDGSPLQGVLMSGLPGDPRTNADGFYTAATPTDWSGMVTPTSPWFTFDPENKSYSPVTSDQPGQDYTANFLGGQDDAYEGNDDMANATPITLGTHYTNLVYLDEDWYEVNITAADAGKDLKVHMKGIAYPDPNVRRDLDFGIWGNSGKLLGYVLSGCDDETLYITDLAEGLYYIGINYFSMNGAIYSLKAEIGDNFGIGYISGRVTDEQSKQGIEGVYIELYGDPFDWDISRPLITTDSNGEYKVGFTPGNYTVRFNLHNNYHRDDRFPDVNYRGKTYNSNEIVPIVAGTIEQGIDAELAPGGAITGRVTGPDGNGLYNAWVSVCKSDISRVSFTYTDENGYYTAERMRTGNYKVRFRATNPYRDTELGMKWYEDGGSFADGLPVPVQAGSTTSGINAQLEESGYIEGYVTNSYGDPIQGVSVVAYDPLGYSIVSGGTDDNGHYRLWRRLPSGDVKIFFNATNAQGNYVSEYYTDKLRIEEADTVTVQSGQTTYDIDAQLADGGTITGRVTDSEGNGLYNIFVICSDIDSDNWYYVYTDGNGDYTIEHILPDNYKVRFRASSGDYATEWHNDKNSFANGDVVSVGAGATVSGINAQLSDNGGFISGRVTDISDSPIEGVRFYARDSHKDASIAWNYTDVDGSYTIPRLPNGDAKVYFDADFNYLNYISEWYYNRDSHDTADLVSTTLGETTPGIDAVLAPIPPLTITTPSPLPNGEVAVPYSATLEVTGGRELYHWSVISGTLPDGMTLYSNGVISGIPTFGGTTNFMVQVTDSCRTQLIDTKSLSITIDVYSGTNPLISGEVIFNSSPLPGVVMDGLPGNPTTSAQGKYIIPVAPGWSGVAKPTKTGYFFDPGSRSYSDVATHRLGQNYTAYELTLNITTDWLLNGTEGYPYSQTLEADGGSGTGTYSWNLVSGLLPYGLTLDSNGVISGTPTNGGNFDFTARVTDTSSPVPQIVEKELSINIQWEGMISEAPILYWKFNEGDGTTAQDSSGKGVHGTLYDNATYTSDAVEGYAVETQGQGWIRAETRERDFYFADEATIMAYFKISDFSEQERFVWKLQYEHPVLGHPYSIEIHMNINGNFLNLDSGNGLKEDIFNCQHFHTNIDLSLPANGFLLGNYNQIALTIKDDLYTVFINGTPVASEQGALFEVNDNIQHFWVTGADWSDYWLEGKIDELAVFNRILNPQEVTEYYTAGPMHLISGTIHLNGSPLPWVSMEGLPGNPSTNENGEYIAPVLPGWSGTVTPNSGGHYFNPANRTYGDVTSDYPGQDYTAYESDSLWILSDWLPDGTKNQLYNMTLEAADGITPYTWSIISGTLPNGLELDSDGSMTGTPGTISGTPTEAGNFSFTVRVVDSNTPQQAATQEFSLNISPEHQGFWTTTYPGGGAMHSMGLAIDPDNSSIVYATAQDRGIFKTTDAGSSWTNLIDNPDWPFGETDYRFFTIHQSSGNYYMCTGGRIYVSSDRGLNWNQIYEREEWDINSLDVAPFSANTIYVGTWQGEMFKTTDGGANWSACGLSGLPTESSIDIITADPKTPSTVYAGMGSGIYKSTNSGDNWTSIDHNIDFEEVEDIEIDPFDTDVIYLHARGVGHGHGIFKSSTGEGDWTYLVNVGGGLWWKGNSIAIDPTNTNIVYVAIDKSILKGTYAENNWTWAEHSVSSTLTESIIIDPSNSQILYAGTHGEGVYKSEDGGVTWNAVNNGIRALSSPGVGHSLEFDESNPNYIYAGTLGGGYRSLDKGATWEKMDFPQENMTAILTHPLAAGTVYAVFNSFWKRTYDIQNGSWLDSSWVDPTNPPFGGVPRMDLGIASNSDYPNILYFTVKHSNDPQSGVYRSDNGGVTWTLKNNGLTHTDVRAIAVHPTNHQVVFAGTEWEWPLDPNKDYGLYKSIDGGEQWNYISCGLPSGMYIHQIQIYPGDPNIMYITGGGEEFCGLFKSEDGGNCWEQVSNNCASPIAVAHDNPNLLYTGDWEGFYVSLNGGRSRMEFNTGLPRNPQVSSIHLDPTDPLHVFIATGAGVYEATFSFDFMITTEGLNSGMVGESYSTTLEAGGGTTPYSWEIVSGSLPVGLTLNTTNGEISGTPLMAGYWDFVVKATDSSSTPKTYTKELTLSIHNTYTLSVDTNPADGGSVSIDPDESKYIEGSMVDVSVTVNQGYIFTGWSGDATGRATLVHVEMTRDKTLMANFALPADLPDYTIDSYSLPAAADAGQIIGGSVSVTVENQGADDTYSGNISVGVYLSSDSVITTSDTLLWKGRSSITALPSGVPTSVTIDPAMQIPTTFSAGSYYIGVLVDESDVIAERDETNNYSSQTISINSPGNGYLELLGMWPGGASNAVACDEARNLTFVGHGALFQVLDVSNPSHPIKIGEVALGTRGVVDIEISGNYAYVTGDGLRIVDITYPTHPIEVGFNASPKMARGLVVSGDYAYVTDHFNQGLRVFNISDPSSPIDVNFIPSPGRTRGIAHSGNYLYLAVGRWLGEGDLGIRIMNITDPANPWQERFYPMSTGAGWPEVSGNYLLLPTNSEGLHILDISNAPNLTQAAVYDGLGTSGWVKVVGDHAYITDGDRNAVVILNIFDLNNVYEVGVHHFEDQNSINSMDVLGNYCFANGWYHSLKILNMSDPQNPYEIGSYDEYEGILRDIDVSEDHAYMTSFKSNGIGRFRTLDIPTLSDIDIVGTFNNPRNMFQVRISGDFAYLLTADEKLKVLDISDPSNPHEVAVLEEFNNVYDLEVSGNYAFIADYNEGLKIIDISTPSNPTHVSTWYTPSRAYRVAISGNFAYVSAFGRGVRIIDISDPMNPWEVGSHETEDFRAYEIEVSGNYVYVEDWDYNMRIIDVSDPQSPVETATLVTNLADIYDIEVSGNIVFLAGVAPGMIVIDVSDPSNPVKIDEHQTFIARSIVIKENYIYLLDRSAGLFVYEFQLPAPEQTISGKITTDGANPQGVLMAGLPGSPTTTNQAGEYIATVPYAWSGTVTPTLAGYYFIPSSRTYDTVTSNQLNQYYTAHAGDPLVITTTWLSDGIVSTGYSKTLDATGGSPNYTWSVVYASLPDGLNLNPSTGEISGSPTETGTFTFTVQVTDSGSQQQSSTRELSLNINAYAGTGYIISGTVTADGLPLDGVMMTGLPGNPTTNASGFYMATVDNGWSGTVFPSKINHAFDPSSRNYPSVTSNQMDQDYEAGSITEEWVARYNGPAANSSDTARAVATDSSGNIYVTGNSQGSGTNGDIATIKYDSTGGKIWEARYNGQGNSGDYGSAIAVDSAGNVYVTGDSGYRQAYDYATIKYNSNGDQVWMAGYDGPGNNIDVAVDIAVDSAGNVYVTGYSYGSTGNYDFATIKYDSNGDQIWAARYDGPVNGDDRPVGIAVDSSGNVYVTGRSHGDGTNYDYATIKYDNNGNQDWVERHDSIEGNDRPSAMVLDAAANVYVTGYSRRSETYYDYATIKYDSNGNKQWTTEWTDGVAWYDNASNTDYPQALILDSSGNVYVTGYSQGSSSYDYATVMYNSSGVEQWTTTYDGPANNDDRAFAVDVDSAGNIYVTGRSFGSNEFNEYATVKYSSTGSELWVRRYDGSANGNEYTYAIVVDPSGNIVVTGSSHGSSTNNDYATIKYDNSGNLLWNTEGDGAVRYNGPTNEENMNWAYGDIMAMDDSNNVYISGYSYGNGTDYDYTTVKFDSSGNQVWAAQYNGPGNYIDYAEDMTVDPSGNVYVTGATYTNATDRDYATVKYNSAGVEQWAVTYNGLGEGLDWAYALAVDTSGNVYVTGESLGIDTSYDCTTIKYNSAGVEQWVNRYDGSLNRADEGWGITVDTSGDVYVTGRTYTGSTERYDFLIIKYNSAGVEQWVSAYNGPENQNDNAYYIALDSSNNVYVCGTSAGDYATVKYNSAGDFQWAARYDGPGNSTELPLCLAVDSADDVYITGRSLGSGTYYDFATVKYDSAGNELWVRRYEGESEGSYDYGTDIDFDSSGNVYVSGRSGGTDTHYDSDCATIKYDSNGNQLWILKYNGPGNKTDAGFAISVTSSGDVYVAGISAGIGTGADFFVIKYRQ